MQMCVTAHISQHIHASFTPSQSVPGQTSIASEAKVSKTLTTDSKSLLKLQFSKDSHVQLFPHPIFLLGNEIGLYCTDDH